ncbi:carboxylesterase/lipase family protein [Mycolicibacter kumamotonensis]|uniref:Carboxylic ester hydrolase n=1 Tax=Mycolicibacter kumamotonensis TaxID=354243 RepID=A0A7K3L6Q9_9MYCO|nr:carboxylesterase/lipase family protein [Mycolicibacter kumamotonensis]NDJ87932.1 carboxylesterase/lipase family protein [Mycolicibacter kumamotonensis]
MTRIRDEKVTTHSGVVVGFTRDDVIRWRSIPYAQPPVGPLRLRAPRPPVPWSGARYCDEFGFAAPQRRIYTVMGLGRFQPISEDCLTLNVFAPATISDEPLPVMFFIHGGAYMLGSSAPYDGAALARRGCVFVSVNYRLGALGCMDLSSLSTPDVTIDGNLYLRDLVLALQWVRDNIADFGGDPAKVTIIGESAGAHAVSTLLAVPAAAGLFARAVVESTTLGLVRTADEAAGFAEKLVALLGAHPQDGAAALMQADSTRLIAAVDQLLKSTARETMGAAPFGPSIDGDYLPRDPLQAMADGQAHPVPLIVGSNLDEGRLFTRMLAYMPLTEPLIEEMLAEADPAVRARIDAAYPGYPRADVCIRLGGDRFFGLAAWQIAEAHGKHQPTFVYRYDYAPRILHWLKMGATHGTELLAVFDIYRTRLGRLLTLAGDRRAALRVTDDMLGRWRAFAATGIPGAGWPAYSDDDDRAVMIFDRTARVESDPAASQRQAWNAFVPMETRLESGASDDT